jgi:hypothetical protein
VGGAGGDGRVARHKTDGAAGSARVEHGADAERGGGPVGDGVGAGHGDAAPTRAALPADGRPERAGAGVRDDQGAPQTGTVARHLPTGRAAGGRLRRRHRLPARPPPLGRPHGAARRRKVLSSPQRTRLGCVRRKKHLHNETNKFYAMYDEYVYFEKWDVDIGW